VDYNNGVETNTKYIIEINEGTDPYFRQFLVQNERGMWGLTFNLSRAYKFDDVDDSKAFLNLNVLKGKNPKILKVEVKYIITEYVEVEK
jgi:hypothetical protein